jgi:hypothetical protein
MPRCGLALAYSSPSHLRALNELTASHDCEDREKEKSGIEKSGIEKRRATAERSRREGIEARGVEASCKVSP